jgi:O-antigen/teichoic acid export membrane protein
MADAAVAGGAKRRTGRMVVSFLAIGCSRGFQIGCSLISIPLLLNHLGPSRFGLWAAVTSILSIQNFFDLGIGNALTNCIADTGGGDVQASRRAISSAFALLLLLSAIMLVAIFLGVPLVNWAVFYKVGDGSSAQEMTMLALLCVAVMVPMHVVSGARRGLQENHIHAFWDGFIAVLSFCALWTCLRMGVDLFLLVAASMISPVVGLMSNGGSLFWRERSALRPCWRYVDRASALALVRSAGLFFLVSVGTIVGLYCDNLIAVNAVGPEASAQFAIAFKALGACQSLLALLLQPCWPAYGEAIMRGDRPWIRRTILRVAVVSTAGAALLSVGLALYGQQAIAFWAGGAAQIPQPLLEAFAVWLPVYSCGLALSGLYSVSRFLPLQAAIWSVFGIVAVVAKLLLAQAYGCTGIVWGSVGVFSAIVLVPYALMLGRITERI